MSTGSTIVGAGHYQPAQVLTNADLADHRRHQRRVDPEPGRDPGAPHRRHPTNRSTRWPRRAADKAVANAGIDRADIDLVLVATCTAIDRSPNIAARVAARLGLGTRPRST